MDEIAAISPIIGKKMATYRASSPREVEEAVQFFPTKVRYIKKGKR